MAAAAILASAVLQRVHAEPDSASTDAKVVPVAAQAGVESWDSESVATWMASRGLPAEVVRAAREADVDGGTLLELTHEGWAELGCAPQAIEGALGVGYCGRMQRSLGCLGCGKSPDAWLAPSQSDLVSPIWKIRALHSKVHRFEPQTQTVNSRTVCQPD